MPGDSTTSVSTIRNNKLSDSVTSKHSQAELGNTRDTISEQCLITKAFGGATRMTRLKMRVEYPEEFRLNESTK